MSNWFKGYSGWWRRPVGQPAEIVTAQAAPGVGVVVVAGLTAAQIASAAADFPLVMSANAVFAASNDVSFAIWWSLVGRFDTGLQAVDPTAPTYNLYDSKFDVFSQPSTAATTWFLLLNFGATVQAFDSAMILGHNFGSIGGLTVTLQVADTSDFLTNLRTVATWNPGTSNKRLVYVGAGGSAAYSNVEYARLQITGAVAFIPQVGELILSPRQQLNQGMLGPYGPDDQVGRQADFDGRSGVLTRYDFHHRRAYLKGTTVPANSTDAAIVTGWWDDSAGGMRPFGWIERPTTAPNTAFLMFHSMPSRILPFETDKIRRYQVDMIEQGAPFFANEV